WVTAQGARIEFTNATTMFPAGTILLRMTGQAPVLLNPRDHTYSRIPMSTMQPLSPQAQELLAQLKPTVSVTRTGEVMTIAGVDAEHVIVTSTRNMSLPAGLPPA